MHTFLMDEIPLDILNNKENIINNNTIICTKCPEEIQKLSHDDEAMLNEEKEKSSIKSRLREVLVLCIIILINRPGDPNFLSNIFEFQKCCFGWHSQQSLLNIVRHCKETVGISMV